jgi:hypothetical protein
VKKSIIEPAGTATLSKADAEALAEAQGKIMAPGAAAIAPTPGRIVHFYLPDGSVRPAQVVRVFEGGSYVNLQVYTDGLNDLRTVDKHGRRVFPRASCESGLCWMTSVEHGTGVGQWSWPPRSG